MDLKNRVAIVTGAGGGIGRAIAVKFAALGANVVVADIKEEGARETVFLVGKSGPKGLALNTDITSFAQVQEMARATLSAFGKVDILVNNAGWDKIEPFVKNSPDLWDRVIAVNLKGPIHCTRAVLDPMMERKQGKIINISSDAGRVGSTGEAVYSACKGGSSLSPRPWRGNWPGTRSTSTASVPGRRTPLSWRRSPAERPGPRSSKPWSKPSLSAGWPSRRTSPGRLSSWLPTKLLSSPAKP